jgi:hypothetical protein
VSFETSFDSKQPKLEPKLVSALSETKRLFRLFRFYTETEIFDVSIELKQTEDQPKQFDREHILLFFTENLEFFRFFLGFFDFFRFFQFFSVCFETVCFGCFASILKQIVSMFRLNRNKQKTHPNSLKVSIFEYFSENVGLLQFVSVCYETVLFFFFFGCFDIGSKHRNKPKFLVFGFTKQTETNAKQILLQFVSVRTEIYFCLFRGHPSHEIFSDRTLVCTIQ